MDEIEQDHWWNEHFLPGNKASRTQFMSRDGSAVVELQEKPEGLRGFYAGVMRLATAIERDPAIKRACLAIDSTDLSLSRLQREWATVRRLFRKDIAGRLALVALAEPDENSWIEPEEEFVENIRSAMLRRWNRTTQQRLVRIRPVADQRYFEIVKVLLVRWLRKHGPIAIGQLAKDVGCSYPTVREALRRLQDKRYLAKESSRSVQLAKFPQEPWQELMARAPSLRRPLRFTDESGERPNPDRLLERLKTIRPKQIALGGVLAARHWNPDFDLHGTPRLDLTAHAPNGIADLRFLKRLDPALKQTDDPDAAAVLVIHLLVRSGAMFNEAEPSELPYADSVETVLDLQELGLTQQANQLLSHFRKEARQR